MGSQSNAMAVGRRPDLGGAVPVPIAAELAPDDIAAILPGRRQTGLAEGLAATIACYSNQDARA